MDRFLRGHLFSFLLGIILGGTAGHMITPRVTDFSPAALYSMPWDREGLFHDSSVDRN